jgi:predicted  nucleic acid-binding Zn-ribbon protein
MSLPGIESLLHLQEVDQRLQQLVQQLNEIPLERKKLEAQVQSIREGFKQAQGSVQRLELRRKQLEMDAQTADEKRRRYLTQQLQVKKNDEYAALDAEIEQMVQAISQCEDEALTVMMELDEERAKLVQIEQKMQHEIADVDQLLKVLASREAALVGQRQLAESDKIQAESKVERDLLENYRYVRKRVNKPPYLVHVIQQQCQGCFLKISGELYNEVRRGDRWVRCDTCGRFLIA